MQLWKNYGDEFLIELIAPSGKRTGYLIKQNIKYRLDNTEVLVYFGNPTPFSTATEIYFDFIPTGDYIDSGIYRFVFTPVRLILGEINMWLPVESALNNTTFLNPSPEVTLTVPSTALRVISVGAYDAYLGSYAEFSGRGYLREINLVKPDIVAPGVNILAAASFGTTAVSGTSFATPVVSGSAALLMKWGIVKENDLYLYAEKVKAYIIKGARRLPGVREWPNREFGWGALCVRNSFPI